MLEIPSLRPDEKLDHIIGMHLGNTFYPLWYIEERWGEDAVEQYFEWLSEVFMTTVRTLDQASPMKLVMLNAGTEQNLMGSKVEVTGDDDRAVMELIYCRRLAHARRWAKYGTGPERRITRERYCHICLESGLRKLATGLGLEFIVEFTPDGCVQVLGKQEQSQTTGEGTGTGADGGKNA